MQNQRLKQPVHGGNLAWAASLAGCSPSFILDFSASINPLGPPQSVLDAIAHSIHLLRHYPDPGYGALRQALAQHHQLDPEWVLPGNGSAELLTWAGRELADCEATYLPTPAFGDYRRSLNAFDASVVDLPFWVDAPIEQSEQPLVSQGALVLSRCPLPESVPSANCGLIVNNPHNPTGQLFAQSTLLPALERFRLVVVDEAFMDFLPPEYDQSVAALVMQHPNLVVLRSLTKFYSLPGLRLGYAIAHPDRLRLWQQWRDPWSVNTLAEVAAIAALADAPFQQQTWDWLSAARSQVFTGLRHISGLTPLPGAANYLLVKSDRSAVELQHNLLKHHRILIRDCISFPELGDRYFRIAIRTPTENQTLLTALTQALFSNL
ncbi:threonine-phosphate decarboxylase CobD [Leptolyngbya sp. AN02str]|uniref:threonine-phosphate decarboxylase CobD n=1 Tax=Leptolyngbya sp. AN02str TaxID=3423363 RepID=UPI003D310B50